jgi:arginine decarboxylase
LRENVADGEGWSIQNSTELYGLERWGDPYFSINARGHISVQPQGERGGSLDLHDLVQELRSRNLSLPLLIRFDDILETGSNGSTAPLNVQSPNTATRGDIKGYSR